MPLQPTRMKLNNIHDVVKNANVILQQGGHVFQQWECEHCLAKQTMPDKNIFYREGECEECQKITNIEKNGCNYMMVVGVGAADDIERILRSL